MTHRRSPLGDSIPIIGWFDDAMIEGERLAEERKIQRKEKARIERNFRSKLNNNFLEKATFRLEVVGNGWVNLTYLDEYGTSKVSGFFKSTIEALMGGLTRVRKHSILKFSKTKKAGYKKIKFKFQPIPDVSLGCRNLYFETEPNVVDGYTQYIAHGEQCWGQGFEFMLPYLGMDPNAEKIVRRIAYMKLESIDVSDFT